MIASMKLTMVCYGVGRLNPKKKTKVSPGYLDEIHIQVQEIWDYSHVRKLSECENVKLMFSVNTTKRN